MFWKVRTPTPISSEKLCDQFLGIVWAVKRFTLRIHPGAGMITTDNQIVGAKIPPDDRMPQRLAWSCQAHRKRKQRQQDTRRVKETGFQGAVGPNTRIVIDVTRLGHPDDRVEQEHAIHGFNRTNGEFLVRLVKWIAGLKGDHIGS